MWNYYIPIWQLVIINNKYFIMEKVMKLIFLLLSLLFILNTCCNTWTWASTYKITGTKTNVTIKYRGKDKNDNQSKEYTTITVDKLPWEIGVFVSQSSCKDRLPWFLSAYSDSEGEMIIYINTDSNSTTNNYIELSSYPPRR